MRSQVRTLGRLSGMQLLVNSLREFAADPFHLTQFFHACRGDTTQAAETREQAVPAFGADSRDVFQGGMSARLGAANAMSRNREAVRFIPDLLQQMQSGMFGR